MPTVDEMTEAMWPSREAERSYLAAVLNRDDATELLWRSSVEPMHLESTQHAAILEAMIGLRDRGAPVHMLAVAEMLADTELAAIVWHLDDHWANPGFAEFFAEQVMARYRRRSVRELGLALENIAGTVPGPQLDTEVEGVVEAVLAKPAVREQHTTDVSLHTRAFGARPHDRMLGTPWPILDRAIKGFRRTGLYTLSGDTGSGKSALALQVAHSLSRHGTVVYFSMEMSEPELQDRLIAQQCGVTLDLVEKQQWPEGPIRDRVERFVNARTPLAFEDASTVSVAEVRRAALGYSDLAAVVIDQLPLMEMGVKKGENLPDAIARTVYGLKNLAVDLEIPVVMLTQLNREASRASRPTRHHLYGSSAIANASDVILILHREDVQRPENLELIVDKNRQGAEGRLDLSWEGGFVRAVDGGWS